MKRHCICDIVECVCNFAGSVSAREIATNTLVYYPACHDTQIIWRKFNGWEVVSGLAASLKLELACTCYQFDQELDNLKGAKQ